MLKSQCRPEGREGGTTYPGTAVRKGTHGRLCCTFVVCPSSTIVRRLYKLALFRPTPRHSATESQSFRFNINTFGRGRKIFCTGARTRCRRPFVRSLHDCSRTSRTAPLTYPPVLTAVSSTQWFLIHVRISWKTTECFSLLNHFHRFALKK